MVTVIFECWDYQYRCESVLEMTGLYLIPYQRSKMLDVTILFHLN